MKVILMNKYTKKLAAQPLQHEKLFTLTKSTILKTVSHVLATQGIWMTNNVTGSSMSFEKITMHPLKRSETLWVASVNDKFELLQLNQATTIVSCITSHF